MTPTVSPPEHDAARRWLNGDARLAAPAATAWLTAGIAVGFAELDAVVVLAWICVAVGGVAAVATRARTLRATGLVLVCAAVSAMILTSVVGAQALREPAGLESGARITGIVRLTGVPETDAGGRDAAQITARVPGELVSARTGSGETGASAPVLIFADGSDMALRAGIGALVEVTGEIQSTDRGEHIAWLLFANGEARSLTDPPALYSAASMLRANFSHWSSSLPGDGGVLLPGLAIGDTSAVPQRLDDAMTESSLSHLTAVSGANCVIVVAAAMGVAALLGAGRLLRVGIAIAALAGFVVLVTPEPSVLRAAVMALAALAGSVLGRGGGGLAALGVAVIGLLTFDPWLSREYGFVLSVLATAGLIVLAPPITAVLTRWMPLPIAAAIAVPTAAQAACQPVLILLDPSLPLLSVVSNLLAAPAAPIATVLGLISALTLPILPLVGGAIGWLAWLPATWIAGVATVSANVPARLPWLAGWWGVAVLVLVGAAVGVGIVAKRRMVLLAGIAVAVLVVAVLQGQQLGVLLTRPADWSVVSCDVGQGAATLVRSGDAVALVDVGDDPERLKRCLHEAGVSRIDLLVLTHFDRDHVGAVDQVLGEVDQVLAGPSDGEAAESILDSLEQHGALIHQTVRGDRGSFGDGTWSALWPLADASPGNDASIVTRFDLPELSVLVLGDVGADAQRALLREGPIASVDVVGVAHHGSADQLPELYSELGAAVALVSVGLDNDYGHPAPSLLTTLEATGAQIVRTDTSGSAFLARREAALTIWTAPGPLAATD